MRPAAAQPAGAIYTTRPTTMGRAIAAHLERQDIALPHRFELDKLSRDPGDGSRRIPVADLGRPGWLRAAGSATRSMWSNMPFAPLSRTIDAGPPGPGVCWATFAGGPDSRDELCAGILSGMIVRAGRIAELPLLSGQSCACCQAPRPIFSHLGQLACSFGKLRPCDLGPPPPQGPRPGAVLGLVGRVVLLPGRGRPSCRRSSRLRNGLLLCACNRLGKPGIPRDRVHRPHCSPSAWIGFSAQHCRKLWAMELRARSTSTG